MQNQRQGSTILVCSFKAWDSIVKDIDLGDLNLDQLQSRQASKNRESAAEAVNRTIRETYRWLLAPLKKPRAKGFRDALGELPVEHWHRLFHERN